MMISRTSSCRYDAPMEDEAEEGHTYTHVLGGRLSVCHPARLTAVLEAADGVIEIPCFGSKNSLNVCSAASQPCGAAARDRGRPQRSG